MSHLVKCSRSIRTRFPYVNDYLQLNNKTLARCYSDVLQGGEGGEKKDVFKPSIIPTDHFQDSLPRLPVPSLEKTCARYLSAQKVLLTDDEFKKTEAIVTQFRDGEGKELHEQLLAVNKLNSHTSYVTEHWFDMYLKDRRPVVINHNPFIIMQNDSRTAYNRPDIRITNIIISSMRFRRALLDNVLEPEVFHLDPKKSDTLSFRRVTRMLPRAFSWYGAYMYNAYPLDMSQYGNLFNSTRKPRKGRDDLFTDRKGRHVLFLRKGNFYTVNVLNEDGTLLPEADILADVKHVLENQDPPNPHPLGILTTEGRDRWAQLRNSLIATGNTDPLRKIDNALFVVAYDDEPSSGFSQNSSVFLHGDGANRWFDKSFTVVVLGDGTAGINFEHSWGDGVAVLRYVNDIFKDTTQNSRVTPSTNPSNIDSVSRVKKLEFQLTDEVKATIKEAQSKFKQTSSNVQFQYLLYENLSRELFKRSQLYPDAMMQLVFQMAYRKQHGGTAATYESSSTAAFKHGRTETIRPATQATKKACELFDGKVQASKQDLMAALKECSSQHASLTKDAAMGQGFDRHLFVLRIMAEQRKGELPEIFRDPAYAKINHNILSTSTLSSPAIMYGGFGPVVPDGYGIGYGVFDNFVGCNVSVYKDKRNVNDFLECARASFDQIANLIRS